MNNNKDKDPTELIDRMLDKMLETLGKASKLYLQLGFGGFLTVVGTTTMLFTIAVAFCTDPSSEGSSLLHIDRGEELMFMISGICLTLIGGSFIVFRTLMINRNKRLEHEIQLTKIKLVHERKVIALQENSEQGEAKSSEDVPKG